jgi:hypothetical protein
LSDTTTLHIHGGIRLSATQHALNATQAQKILDYVALRLESVDDATSERLLDEFVDRLRKLGDIAEIKGRIAHADHAALKPLGGVDAARNLMELIEKIGQD